MATPIRDKGTSSASKKPLNGSTPASITGTPSGNNGNDILTSNTKSAKELMFKILTGPAASTKADHVVRSRVLVCPNDLRNLQVTSGDAVWVENPDNDNARFICTISSLTSVKAGTCMLSQEAAEEAEGWTKAFIRLIDVAIRDADEVVLSGLALTELDWKKPLATYILSRLDGCIVSEGTRIGVLLGGYLRVLRISKCMPPAAASRVRVKRTNLSPSSEIPGSSEEDKSRGREAPFAGLDHELERLLSLMRQCFSVNNVRNGSSSLSFKPVRGALLFGPPGTGKTLLARKAAETFRNCVLMEVEDETTAVETISMAFRPTKAGECRMLLFDEIDVLCASNREIVSTLLTNTDRDDSRTFFLACTNHPEALEPALRRPGRLDEEIEIPPPSAGQRSAILKAHLNKFPHDVSEVDLDRFASKLHGFVGADIMHLCSEAAYSCVEEFKARLITLDHFNAALKRVQPSCLREVQITVPHVRWEDIGGMEEVKQAVREAVELPLKHPEAFRRLGIRPPQGVLLYGPPGCSKTLLAKAVATESEMNFIAVKGPELLSKWVGDSEKAIKATFRRANQSKPCVVFLDEIDALASSRESSSSGGGGVSHRVTSQLLQELDGIQPRSGVVVLCATNRPDLLDPALLRPGRIDRLVYVPPPDLHARLSILEINLKNIPHDFSYERLKEIDTEAFSGAEVASICRDAALKALERDLDVKSVSLEELQDAARRVVPQITRQVLDFYDRFKNGQPNAAE